MARSVTKNMVRAAVGILLGAILALADGPGFRTNHLLEDHFIRYGKQFGAINIQQYLRLAQQLRDTTSAKGILTSRRPEGGGSKFDLKRGWFVAYDGDGTLRTFFKPKDGVRFFHRQEKSAMPPE